MFMIKIWGYRYGTNGDPVAIQCGGYAYGAGSLIKKDCHVEGTDDPVGIGVENDVVIITIGPKNSAWYYDHFTFEYRGWKGKLVSDFSWEFVHNESPTTENFNKVTIDDSKGRVKISDYLLVGADSNLSPLSIKKSGRHIGGTFHSLIQAKGNGNQGGVYVGYNSREDYAGAIGSVSNSLSFWLHNGSEWLERMTLLKNGDVGIGTTAPNSKLAVKGKVTAKEVEVTMSGWSDYVFEEDYNLKSLPQTESYIKANKHLPGIPSEKEVKEKGINLGEMQAKLLAKIEELTLHLIEQNKRLENQEQKISKLIDENIDLKSMLEATK